MKRQHNMTFEEILDLMLLEEPEPNHAALVKWCQRYPEHRDELTRFFATWAVQCESSEDVAIDEERIGNWMVSHAMNLLHNDQAIAESAPHDVPAARLRDEIKSHGLSEEEFCRQCQLDVSLVAKLDRRLIRVGSIPHTCIAWMSTALGRAGSWIARLLTGPPIVAMNHKAKVRPVPKIEEFVDAVRTSNLADETKREWLRIVESERPTEGPE